MPPRPLSKLVGTGMGVYKEWQAKKESENANKQTSEQSGIDKHEGETVHGSEVHDYDDDEEDEFDDETLAQDLDATQAELVPTQENQSEEIDEKKWLDRFLHAHPPPEKQLHQPLSMPVIIPERRPGFKTRGFVRAYAPVLQEAGIDQDTWMEILKGFDQSIGNHKWFHVANVAVWVAEQVRLAVQGVSIIAKVVTLVAHISIEASRRGFMNVQQNTFLDGLNEGFFKPRGLFAMVIKYNPKSNEPVEDVDISANTRQQVAKHDVEDRSKWKSIYQGSAGKALSEEEVPEFAPLEFPQLDQLPEDQKENAVKKFGHFLGEYYDRRGQAKFDARYEDSKLAKLQGEQEFASRHSDPNDQNVHKNIITTVTGGKVNYTSPLDRISEKRTARQDARRSRLGINRKAGAEGRKERKAKRPTRKFLKQDVLYLLVVNMPSEEEIDLALKELEEASKEKGQSFDIKAVKGWLGFGDSILSKRRA